MPQIYIHTNAQLLEVGSHAHSTLTVCGTSHMCAFTCLTGVKDVHLQESYQITDNSSIK